MHKYKDESEVIRIENAIPAIVSKDLWERANASRKIAAKTSTNAKYNYLLSGLIYCGECGAKFHGTHRKYGANAYNTYRCNRRDNQLMCGCKEIRADVLENFVIDSLTEHFFNDGIVDIITSQINEKIAEKLNRDNETIAQIKSSLTGLKTARANLVDAIAQTGFNQTLSDKLNSIEKQISTYEAMLEEDKAKKGEIKVTKANVKKKISELKEYMKNPANIEQTKMLLRSYIDRIEVDNKTIRVTFRVAFSFLLDNTKQEEFYNHTVKEYRLLLESKNGCRGTHKNIGA